MFTWPNWMERVAERFFAIPRWARYTIAALGLVLAGGVLF